MGIASGHSDPADPRGRFGELVRGRRVAAGLTQEELAERSGLGVRTISDIERGRIGRPHRRSVDLLCDALGLARPGRDRSGRGPGRRSGPGGNDRGWDSAGEWLANWARRNWAGGAALAGAGSARQEAVVPRQLPAAVRHFAGRAAELGSWPGCWTRPTARRARVVISAIAGTAGVGKTALAMHWAHQAAERSRTGSCMSTCAASTRPAPR